MPPSRKTVLIVDDDEGMREMLVAILAGEYRTLALGSAELAVDTMRREAVDIVLADVRLPGMSGLDLLRIVKEQQPLVEVLVISAVNEVETAVQAMKQGAYHYVTKDFEYDSLRSVVRNAAEKQDLNRRVLALSAQVDEQGDREVVVGPSAAMRDTMSAAAKVARVPATVLVLGESGTGKELVARWIHNHSAQADGPFIAVNLAAIPADLVESTLFGHERGSFTGAARQQLGKFELATGGTLFLDEIGDLRLDLQSKLLRAIQEGEVERLGGSRPVKTDFRLICATNQDLERAVRDGRFRDDLYYRINVVPMEVPPLRARLDDVPVLVQHFLERFSRRFRKPLPAVSAGAMKRAAASSLAGQRPRTAEPRRAARRDARGHGDRGRGPAVRLPRLVAAAVGGQRAGRGGHHVRTQFHPARARTLGRQRDGHGACAGRPAQHLEAPHEPPRRPRPRPSTAPARQPTGSLTG